MKYKAIKIILIILVLCFLKSFFFFTGPVRGVIKDAKTGKPLSNVDVELIINVSSMGWVGGGGGWDYEESVLTDNNGEFNFSRWLHVQRNDWRRVSQGRQFY